MIHYKIITNPGGREINEDFVGLKVKGEGACFVLADGLGGHGKGEVASELVVKTALTEYERNGESSHFFEETFERCQKELMKEQERQNSKDAMKTTMVMCRVTEKSVSWGHIGDSRLYLFRGGHLKCRTLDHSVPQMLVYAGDIKEKDIRFHPDRNRLLKVMGTEWSKPDYEVADTIKRLRRQAILMCTDGFWEYITEKQMINCLKKAKTVQEWADIMTKIVQEADSNTERDNFSAICVWL